MFPKPNVNLRKGAAGGMRWTQQRTSQKPERWGQGATAASQSRHCLKGILGVKGEIANAEDARNQGSTSSGARSTQRVLMRDCSDSLALVSNSPSFSHRMLSWPSELNKTWKRRRSSEEGRKKQALLHSCPLPSPCLRQVSAKGGKHSHWMRVQSLMDRPGHLMFELDQKSYWIAWDFTQWVVKNNSSLQSIWWEMVRKERCCFLGRIFDVQFIHPYIFIY